MIKKIIIEKLFDRFNYEIDLKPEGVTIITGPNGYGKSTILRCIEALSKGDLLFFVKLDFNFIKIETNEMDIMIENRENAIVINKTKIPVDLIARYKFNMKRKPYISKLEKDRWLDRRTGEIYDENDMLEHFIFEEIHDINDIHDINETYSIKSANNIYSNYVNTIQKIKKAIGEIYYIKEQRLIMGKMNGRAEREIVDAIEELPNKFKKLISDISNNYSTIANELDSTYPTRLFKMDQGISENEYNEKMSEMTNKFEKLNKYDISVIKTLTNIEFKKEHARALKIYIDDFNEKYKVYEDFIRKLDLFTDIVNSRLSFKQIKISRENGIIVTDNETEVKLLKLSQLSSGEKQEIVLFYELIFETINNVLLLIDEPEISLHIIWQKMFMDDLLEIVKYKGINVIVATHSPQIINNHWDINIDLGELYGNQLN